MKINRRSLAVIVTLLIVVAGAVLLLPNSSKRDEPVVIQDDHAQEDVKPVREDPYAVIAPELLQAMNDIKAAREPEVRDSASEKLIAHTKVINSNLDAGKDAIKREIQFNSLNERLGFLEHRRDEYTLQEKVEIAFTLEDLPHFRATLTDLERADQWWAATMALAILEPDKERAFESLNEFVERPEDWVALHQLNPNWADAIARQKYLAVSGFGYVNSDKANDYLLSLMKKEQARELLLKSNGGLPGLVDESECIWLIQKSAAHGIMVTRNQELIPYLVDANIQAAEEFQEDHGVNSGRLTADLDAILAMHYYYQEHGWEGGYRLRAIMKVPLYPEIAIEPVRTYYDEYLFEYYSVQKVYKMQHERGLVTEGTKYYLEKYKSEEGK